MIKEIYVTRPKKPIAPNGHHSCNPEIFNFEWNVDESAPSKWSWKTKKAKK